MKLLIIHLSDIHIKEEKNPILNKKEQLYKALQNLTILTDHLFIVVSGDIAHSGKDQEYNQAIDLFDYLRSNIETYSKKRIRFIMIPGNHDCFLEIADWKIRETLIKAIQEYGDAKIDNRVIDKCCEVQGNFTDFCELYKDDCNVLYSDKLLSVIKYHFEGFSIIFYCYNTAWMSEANEQCSKLHYPIKIFPKEYFDLKSNLNVSILHHPFYWQNTSMAKELSDHVEQTSDIVITGHSHIPSKSVKDNLEGNYTEYIEGDKLQAEDEEASGFNVLFFDLETEKQKIQRYEWNEEVYSLKEDTDWFLYKRSKHLSKQVHNINKEFYKELEYAGGPFTHPNKSKIILSDIFVYPRLRDLTIDKTKNKDILSPPSDSRILREADESGNQILIIGGAKSGRTSLCKTLYKYFHENDYMPVYITGDKIKYTDIERFNKALHRCYKEQYAEDSLENFIQLENQKKWVIIDDLDKSKLNVKYKMIFINKMSNYYPNIIITGSYFFQIEELFSEENEGNIVLEKYKRYEILELDNTLRSELINKWNILGIEEYITEEELIRKNDESKLIVDTVIGKNLIPAYPIFILTILQSIEGRQSQSLAESAYGHYYHFLIINATGKMVKTNDKIDAYFYFLTELANYMFEKKIRKISKDEFIQFHDWYCDEFKVSPIFRELYYFNELESNLINAGLIEIKLDSYVFTPKYVYYFFAARYLAMNIAHPDIKRTISEMCKRLYREEFANIIVFLTHHSKDPFIINEIVNNAKPLFSQFETVKFEKDIESINNLLDKIPKLVLEERDIKKYRAERDIIQDEIELATEEEEEEEEETPYFLEEIIELNFISKLNLTFKMIEYAYPVSSGAPFSAFG